MFPVPNPCTIEYILDNLYMPRYICKYRIYVPKNNRSWRVCEDSKVFSIHADANDEIGSRERRLLFDQFSLFVLA